VRALVLGGHEVTVACYFEHTPYMVQQFEEAGARVVLFSPDGVRLGGWRIVPFLYKNLCSVIKAVRPDIVHVQYMAPGAMVILLLWLLGVKNIIATAHTAADIYRDLRLIHFIQRHCVRAWISITERAECSFFGTSQLYSKDMVLGKRNHFTIYNALPFRQQVNCDDSQVNAPCAVNVALPRLNAAEQQVNSDDSQVNALCAVNVALPRLNAAEQRLIATASQVNVAEQRLKDTQSQGDDSPATPLRLTSSPAAINRSEAAFTLGVVSRLEHIKGMDLVIPAFAEARKRFPDVRLLVVGDGSLRGSMEQQAQELGCADTVTWAGRQPQESLPQYYSRMDIVLMPSRSEGFGLTAIEAMAHGCVVVASDVGGLPEVVSDGVCGLLHRSEDVADMAEKICSLIASPEHCRTMQKNALQHVQKFSFQRYAELILNLYDKL
jgi:glycosyltransferase involved in cell wall biosynthesis